MAYVGNTPALKYSELVQQTFSSPTGTGFTLSQSVTNAKDIMLYINNVKQNPTGAYTASGTTLTVSEALVSGDTMYCMYYGRAVETLGLTTGQVATTHLADNSVTAAKIPADAVGSSEIADNAVTGAKIAMTSDARGDILYYNGTDYARLAKGSSGQVLKMGANDPAWGTDSAVDLTADQSWTGSQRATMVTDNDGSFDMNAGQNFNCTPSGNFTLTFTNIANGQSGFIILINPNGRTVSLHSNSKADANLAGVVSTAGTYILSYISNGTNVYLTNSAVIA